LSKILGTDLEDDVVGQQLRLVKKMKNLEKENDNYTDQLAEANDKCDKLEELFKELAGTLKDEDRATWLERLEGIKDE
jgi:hemerythrin superfamily protein